MIVSYLWDFGDGTQSSDQNPVHVYKMAGTYTVTLTIVNDLGETHTTTKEDYISVSSSDYLINGRSINRPNTILRYAVKPTKGRGWSKYTGHYPLPDVRTGTLKLFDDKNQLRQLVYDSDDRRYYEIGLRKGPENSGLEIVYKDKNSSSYGGYSIPCEIHFREDKAEHEHMPIDHEESHCYFRPQDDDNIGDSGYDENGYLNGLEIDFAMRINGSIIDNADTKNVPKTGDVAYDKPVNGRRLQPIIRMSESAWKLTGVDHYYNRSDKAGTRDEKIMSEQTWQREYSEPIIWFTRYKIPDMNLANGSRLDGSYSALCEGPDGLSDSAIIFGIADGFTYDNVDVDGDFTIQFSIADIAPPCTIITIGAMTVTFDALYDITISLGGFTETYDLDWDGSGWITIKISRHGANLIVSENGNTVNTLGFSTADLSGTASIMVNTEGRVHDFRFYENTISADAFEYYYNRLINDSGKQLLPIF